MKEKTRGTVGEKNSEVFLENKQKKKTKSGYCQLKLKKRGKTQKRCGWKTRKTEREMKEEREDLSCMIGVSGRFLCDIQVEAWA